MGEELIHLHSADGARARLHLHGGHLLSWIPAGETKDRLYLSPISKAAPGVAIRGGVPVIFPQFASEGPLPKHGFARTAPWSLASLDSDRAVLRLADSAETRAIWPHRFGAELRVSITDKRLETQLRVENHGDQGFRFTAALHTYLRVGDIAQAELFGLQGLRYRDSAANGVERTEPASPTRIDGEVDRIYFRAPAELQLRQGGTRLRIAQAGFTDTVVWNPGPAKAAALADLEQPEGYRRMLCVEAAVIGLPVQLEPGASWQGSQTLQVV
ncbi:MAG: D-hexose-6-phosphate mutarotase [Stagnimonas sp.]|nr:D-hexose-6-phosphate mutarotase [Stagnimonas sp.]